MQQQHLGRSSPHPPAHKLYNPWRCQSRVLYQSHTPPRCTNTVPKPAAPAPEEAAPDKAARNHSTRRPAPVPRPPKRIRGLPRRTRAIRTPTANPHPGRHSARGPRKAPPATASRAHHTAPWARATALRPHQEPRPRPPHPSRNQTPLSRNGTSAGGQDCPHPRAWHAPVPPRRVPLRRVAHSSQLTARARASTTATHHHAGPAHAHPRALRGAPAQSAPGRRSARAAHSPPGHGARAHRTTPWARATALRPHPAHPEPSDAHTATLRRAHRPPSPIPPQRSPTSPGHHLRFKLLNSRVSKVYVNTSKF